MVTGRRRSDGRLCGCVVVDRRRGHQRGGICSVSSVRRDSREMLGCCDMSIAVFCLHAESEVGVVDVREG